MKKGNLGSCGSRIKQIRVLLGLNQADFAKKLKLSGPTVVSKYEKDQRNPEITTLVKVAQLGDKSLGWLLTGNASNKRARGSNKLDKLVNQLERIYHEGDSKKISGVQAILDMADPAKNKK